MNVISFCFLTGLLHQRYRGLSFHCTSIWEGSGGVLHLRRYTFNLHSHEGLQGRPWSIIRNTCVHLLVLLS